MKKSIIFFLMLSSVYLTSAKAECLEASNSQEIDACAKLAKNSADANLNSSYKKLITRIKSQYAVDVKVGDDFTNKLKESQRAWLKLRDTNCALEAFEIEVGQPAYLTTVNNCVAKMSLERSGYLDRILPDI
ncbi:DUF1311 domain-containing protein [Pseudomonas cichorii]|uniref:lysozyme inhibitor LprI family protein n=1 Tax=Pseudomonas cichorii TaxID=36746 RepID=UPI001C89CDDD|nr:lysozyme inhibitor LprI family protein [Pseudomonas cichorii]MBX8529510.1 DUF1311 domain-containing protein [Pseudomonas cichorii]